ncbi:spore-associated protein A [Streptomyces sp. NPDC050523]|uniref:spore-associated protein A n=1 Tax=Streptomyces sp. NPDC050523 TaxID=3365622 RepID=UPI0037A5603E
MSRTKRVLQGVMVAGAGAVALATLAPTASAAPATTKTAAAATTTAAAAAYNGACGSGYKVVNSTPIGDIGTAYLTYSSATGKNCAVAIRNAAGDPVYMDLIIRRSGTEIFDDQDGGNFRSYVGPVYVKAAGTCVDWWGSMDGVYFGEYGTNCG